MLNRAVKIEVTDHMSTTDPTNASILPSRRARRNADEAARLSRISRSTAGRLRRSTLVTLRWMAIIGQTIALLFVGYGLGFSFPVWPCVAMIVMSILFNIVVTATLPLDRRVSDREAGAQLGFDLLQLAVLLWLTGGMTNPFALLFLAPVVTSATTLSRPVLGVLGVFAAGLSLGLVFESQPLPWDPTGSFDLPLKFRIGTWLALLVGMAFTSMYAWRSAKESRRMSEALAATEAVLAHEQKLSALGGLAAAAAHELGTPLATIQLTAKEIARELKPRSPYREDIDLVLSQTQRCRDILQQLALRGDQGDEIHDQLSVEALLEEAAEPYFGLGKTIDIHVDGESTGPVLRRQAEILYGLKNFIENAVGFARTNVQISGSWTESDLSIAIEDDGRGFDAAVRDRLGEPYVSRRSDTSEAGGLGLGFFIAKTLVERTGGRVEFGNRSEGGARVNLVWPIRVLSV